MTTHVRCGTLFTGDATATRTTATLGFADDGKIAFVCDTGAAPPVGVHDSVLDYSNLFVMPGLIDVHTHLAYGNAKSEEDIDLYQPMEFRALRALFFAQKVVAAGYTAICAPGDVGPSTERHGSCVGWTSDARSPFVSPHVHRCH